MDKSMAQQIIKAVASAQKGNFRRYSFRVCDPNVRATNALGLSADYIPVTGTVLAIYPEDDTLVIREGRKAIFSAFSIQNLSQVPEIGDTVTITPYERRRFNGTKLSDPESVEYRDGMVIKHHVLGESISKIPGVPENASIYLQQMVDQIEKIPADRRRTIAQVLIDSGAYKAPVLFEDIDNNNHLLPKITFAVEVSGVPGTLSVILDSAADTYVIELCLEGQEPDVYEDVYFNTLADVINDLIVKDNSWLQDQVTIVKKGSKRKAG